MHSSALQHTCRNSQKEGSWLKGHRVCVLLTRSLQAWLLPSNKPGALVPEQLHCPKRTVDYRCPKLITWAGSWRWRDCRCWPVRGWPASLMAGLHGPLEELIRIILTLSHLEENVKSALERFLSKTKQNKNFGASKNTSSVIGCECGFLRITQIQYLCLKMILLRWSKTYKSSNSFKAGACLNMIALCLRSAFSLIWSS